MTTIGVKAGMNKKMMMICLKKTIGKASGRGGAARKKYIPTRNRLQGHDVGLASNIKVSRPGMVP